MFQLNMVPGMLRTILKSYLHTLGCFDHIVFHHIGDIQSGIEGIINHEELNFQRF